MSHRPAKRVRCAIYARVSTEYGLEQDFNSLDAQHEAAEAYVRSQAPEGWTLIRARYADGGYSGGSTDRPALQQLLADIRTRKIEVVVVQGRSADPLAGGFRQAGRAVRCPRGLVRLGHPAVQYHHLDGAANPERAALLCPVRARGDRRAHPRQDRGLEAEGIVGRRHGAAWL